MKIVIGQFQYGLFDNGKIELVISKEVPDLISYTNVRKLARTVKTDGEVNWLGTEGVIAISFIRNFEDTKERGGRDGKMVKTFLIRVQDYLKLTNPLNILKSLVDTTIDNKVKATLPTISREI
jgi:hypothetical protein